MARSGRSSPAAAGSTPWGSSSLGIVSSLAGGHPRRHAPGRAAGRLDPAYLAAALAGVLAAYVGDGAPGVALAADRDRRWRSGAGRRPGRSRRRSSVSGVLLSLLGVITAVGGGMVRDVCIGQVPSVLGGNTLYATAALAASGSILLFRRRRAAPGEWRWASSSAPASPSSPAGVAGRCRWTRTTSASPSPAKQLRRLVHHSERAGAKRERRRARHTDAAPGRRERDPDRLNRLPTSVGHDLPGEGVGHVVVADELAGEAARCRGRRSAGRSGSAPTRAAALRQSQR